MIGEIIVGVGIALGMRFEKPVAILDHTNTPMEDLMQVVNHDLSLCLQERLSKMPPPHLQLIAKYPEGMGETKRGVN